MRSPVSAQGEPDPTVADPTADTRIGSDLDTAFYWDGTARRRLLAQRCTACERLWHPPGPACPHCQHLDWTVEDLGTEGTVGVIYSAAKVRAPGSPIQGTDYLVALVEVPDPRRAGEAVRLACNLRGGDLADAVIGAPVTLTFEQLADGGRLPQFRLEQLDLEGPR